MEALSGEAGPDAAAPGELFHLWSRSGRPLRRSGSDRGCSGTREGEGQSGGGGARTARASRWLRPWEQTARPRPTPPRRSRALRGLRKRAAAGGGGEGEPAPAPTPAGGGARGSLGRGPGPPPRPAATPDPPEGPLCLRPSLPYDAKAPPRLRAERLLTGAARPRLRPLVGVPGQADGCLRPEVVQPIKFTVTNIFLACIFR